MTIDPLAGLSSVDWASLRHAYGSAADVPDRLRALAAAGGREQALGALYGNVFHQGSRYEATAPAVPFAAALTAAALHPVFGAEVDEETWRWVDFTELLRDWHLPAERAELREYAGFPADQA